MGANMTDTSTTQFKFSQKDLTPQNIKKIEEFCRANNLTLELKGNQYIVSGKAGDAFDKARKKIQTDTANFRKTNRAMGGSSVPEDVPQSTSQKKKTIGKKQKATDKTTPAKKKATGKTTAHSEVATHPESGKVTPSSKPTTVSTLTQNSAGKVNVAQATPSTTTRTTKQQTPAATRTSATPKPNNTYHPQTWGGAKINEPIPEPGSMYTPAGTNYDGRTTPLKKAKALQKADQAAEMAQKVEAARLNNIAETVRVNGDPLDDIQANRSMRRPNNGHRSSIIYNPSTKVANYDGRTMPLKEAQALQKADQAAEMAQKVEATQRLEAAQAAQRETTVANGAKQAEKATSATKTLRASSAMTDTEYANFIMNNGQSPFQRAASKTFQAAGKGARIAGRVAKGSAPFIMAMAAVDPDGTAEFLDDVTHFRIGKIATETVDGVVQIASHPIDTVMEIGTAIADHYEGTDGFWDGFGRTIIDPLVNIGNVEFALVGSISNSAQASINWVMNACGSNTELVREGTSIHDFQKDPFEFFSNVFTPARRDKTTGLRTDDDFNSIIFRGDTKAFEAYLKTGVDVNKYIAGAHDGGSHPYPTAFALAISEGQFDMANMLLDNKGTYINQQNEVTKDTPLMSAIAYTALDEYSVAYFTGKPDMSKATPEAQAKFAKANALILKMIQDNRLEIEATNNFGETAFLTAAGCGNIAAMTALAEKGANIHHTNTWGENALHIACCNRLMTEELLSRGLDANAKDKDGNTPLMTALEKNAERGGKNDIAVCLLISHMNENGLNALRASQKHSQLLDDWFKRYPQVKEHIISLEDYHPLNKDIHFTQMFTLQTTLSNAQEKQESSVASTRKIERD